MPDQFLELESTEQKDILETLAQELGRKSNVLEKDIWVCWSLDVLFSNPDSLPMAFKGGTSLSKVFNAIDRFSEDIDITIDYRSLAASREDTFDPFAENASRTAIKKYGERLKDSVTSYAKDFLVPQFQGSIENFSGPSNLTVEFNGKSEEIWLYYDSVVDERDDYIREGVKIELGGRNKIEPNDCYTVVPDISPHVDLEFPTARPIVLAAERTFWEKATLIHVECNRPDLRANADRISRHWHDLYLLKNSVVGESAIEDIELLTDVLKIKKTFFRAGYSNYDDCMNGKFRLIPEENCVIELENDYREMSHMIYSDSVDFQQILAELRELEETINTSVLGR